VAARHRSILSWGVDERGLADGEAVWSWRPDAGVKLATMPAHHADDGGKKARSPRRARSKPFKPLRREGRVHLGSTCGSCPVLFFTHGGRGCQPASGLPCALSPKMGALHSKARAIQAARTPAHVWRPSPGWRR